MNRTEEKRLFGNKGYAFDKPDLGFVFHTISRHIKKKCESYQITDNNVIKAMIVYVCRAEAKKIKEDSKYDGWECDEVCSDGVDVDWDIFADADHEDYSSTRKDLFKRIYKCDECLGIIEDRDSESIKMETILRRELKMKEVKHGDSCADDDDDEEVSREQIRSELIVIIINTYRKASVTSSAVEDFMRKHKVMFDNLVSEIKLSDCSDIKKLKKICGQYLFETSEIVELLIKRFGDF